MPVFGLQKALECQFYPQNWHSKGVFPVGVLMTRFYPYLVTGISLDPPK